MHPNWVRIKAGLGENFIQASPTLYCNKSSVGLWSSAEASPSSSASCCWVLKMIITPLLFLHTKPHSRFASGHLAIHFVAPLQWCTYAHISKETSSSREECWWTITYPVTCPVLRQDSWSSYYQPGFIKPATPIPYFTVSQEHCACK